MFPSTPAFPESALLSRSPETGLHLALEAAGISAGDHVLVPALTGSALAGALRRIEAIPVLIDVSPQDWLLDLDLLEHFLMGHTLINEQDTLVLRRNNQPVRAIITVHLNGNPGDLNRLRFIAHRFSLKLIEDACEATGAMYDNRPVGIFGDVGVFCLDEHPSHASGDKGALLLSQEPGVLHTLREHPLYTNYPEEYHLVHFSLEQLPALQQARTADSRILSAVQPLFRDIPGLEWQHVLPQSIPAYNTFSFCCTQATALRAHLAQAGIATTTFTPPLHRLPAFQHCTYIRIHDHARQLFERCIRIPDAHQLSQSEWEHIAGTIQDFFRKHTT